MVENVGTIQGSRLTTIGIQTAEKFVTRETVALPLFADLVLEHESLIDPTDFAVLT